MQGWVELSAYAPLEALLGGSLTAFSFWGVGRLACGRILGSAPEFLRLPVEFVAGVLGTSLIVQGLAMGEASGANAMRGVWIAALLAAVGASFRLLSRSIPTPGGPPRRLLDRWYWAPLALLGAALLIAGAAPESRSDELAYHALATSRLLTDGGLRFYPLPWEASILPQLVWHYALTPLYAIWGSAAAGVASAWAALILAFAAARLVRWQSASDVLGAVAGLIVLAGAYGMVLFSTTGPHAFGCLATFAAVAGVCWAPDVRQAAGLRAYVLAVAVGCAGAVGTKLTMLPVVAIVTALAAADTVHATQDPRERLRLLGLLVAVPTLSVAPLLIWSWAVAGTPLGALSAGLLHAAAFDREALAAYEGTRELFANRFQWRFETAYWSAPLAMFAVVALVLETSAQRRTRLWLITGCQVLVIALLLPREIRHLGGIQYALLASGMVAVSARAGARGHPAEKVALLGAIAAAPWALLALWLATIYLPLMDGAVSARQFLRQYAGLQSDYERLDRLLPPDAKILMGHSRSDSTQYAWYSRPPIYYAPRPVLFRAADVQPRDHVYLLFVGAGSEGTRGRIPLDPWLPPGYVLGRSAYTNAAARFYPSRAPGGNPGLARLDVLELVRQPLASAR